VLYHPRSARKASPIAISGRTSYLRVRLEFLRYPQLIPWFFNTNVVRASTASYRRFTLAMGRSPGFGSTADDLSPFQTRFRSGSGPEALNLAANGNSPAHSSIGTLSALAPSLAARRHRPRTACRRTVSGALSLPSRGAFHLSLAVLVHYRSLWVFSLGRWSSRLPAGFPVPRGTRVAEPRARPAFRLRGCYPLWPTFPGRSARRPAPRGGSATPPVLLPQPRPGNACRLSRRPGLGSAPFARHY
jgi:hypothetical protein